MRIKYGLKELMFVSMLLSGASELSAQSAIYACGHIRRARTTAISNLKNSGYTTAILFNVNVEEDGSLTTDYNWGNQTAAEAGGIICRDGQYVFDQYQPDYISDVESLLAAPTSINRIEICIGGWGNGSYGNIKRLVESAGTGEESVLYRNFKALKEALPQIVAVNNDQEQDYDLASATAFHRMLAEIGFKTTVAPYMYRDYWKELVAALNTTPGTCDVIYLQTYGGGAGNNPSDWKVFGDVPMHIGFDCEASDDLAGMQARFENWRDNDGVAGGFLWNYNDERRNQNAWATAINRVFGTRTTDEGVATFYADASYGGYAIALPVGSFTQADLALYGIQAQDIASLQVADGYSVTGYTGKDFTGQSYTWTASAETMPRWTNRIASLVIEAKEPDGIGEVGAVQAGVMKVELVAGAEAFEVTDAPGKSVEVYNAGGQKVADVVVDQSGTAVIAMSQMADGIYMVKSGDQTAKLMKR